MTSWTNCENFDMDDSGDTLVGGGGVGHDRGGAEGTRLDFEERNDHSVQKETLKLILVGDSGVGKTCLLSQFTDERFYSSFVSTVGIDFKIKTVNIGRRRVTLQMWDTSGQERFRTIIKAYFKGASGIGLVYDVTNPKSFQSITTTWARSIREVSPYSTVLLIGNKIDLVDGEAGETAGPVKNHPLCTVKPQERKISAKDAETLAEIHGYSYIETSAKLNIRVTEAFVGFADYILNVGHQNHKIPSERVSETYTKFLNKTSDRIPFLRRSFLLDKLNYRRPKKRSQFIPSGENSRHFEIDESVVVEERRNLHPTKTKKFSERFSSRNNDKNNSVYAKCFRLCCFM